MTASKIQVGATLLLKSDNAYGFGAMPIQVHEIRHKAGYRTPWIIDNQGRAFKPSDFARAA